MLVVAGSQAAEGVAFLILILRILPNPACRPLSNFKTYSLPLTIVVSRVLCNKNTLRTSSSLHNPKIVKEQRRVMVGPREMLHHGRRTIFNTAAAQSSLPQMADGSGFTVSVGF